MAFLRRICSSACLISGRYSHFCFRTGALSKSKVFRCVAMLCMLPLFSLKLLPSANLRSFRFEINPFAARCPGHSCDTLFFGQSAAHQKRASSQASLVQLAVRAAGGILPCAHSELYQKFDHAVQMETNETFQKSVPEKR